MTVRRLLKAVIALSIVAVAMPLAGPELSAQGGWVCGAYDQTAKRDRAPEPDANGSVFPVVTIHGITGSDDDFDQPIDKSYVGARPEPPRTLLDALAGAADGDLPPGLTGAHVFSFSYTPDSLRWVDNTAVGQKFAETIDCLHERYGVPVSVVAHSMGGLVARWVANSTDSDGVARSTKLGKVITLGTPYRGSDLSSLANGATDGLEGATGPVGAVLNLLCGAAGTATGRGNCGPIPLYASFRSEAGRNLRVGSAELAALLPWPAEVDVTTLAGSQLVPMSLLGSPLNTRLDIGDIAVSTSSATADPTPGRVFTCAYDSATGTARTTFEEILKLADPEARRAKLTGAFLASPCYHSNLMRYVELTNEVLGQLTDWLTANRAAAPVATCPALKVGSWTGDWRSTRYPGDGGTLDATLEVERDAVTGSLSVSGSTSVPGGGISGTIDCEQVTFGRVDSLVEFNGEVAPQGSSMSGRYQASESAGGDSGTFELRSSTGGGSSPVLEFGPEYLTRVLHDADSATSKLRVGPPSSGADSQVWALYDEAGRLAGWALFSYSFSPRLYMGADRFAGYELLFWESTDAAMCDRTAGELAAGNFEVRELVDC